MRKGAQNKGLRPVEQKRSAEEDEAQREAEELLFRRALELASTKKCGGLETRPTGERDG